MGIHHNTTQSTGWEYTTTQHRAQDGNTPQQSTAQGTGWNYERSTPQHTGMTGSHTTHDRAQEGNPRLLNTEHMEDIGETQLHTEHMEDISEHRIVVHMEEIRQPWVKLS